IRTTELERRLLLIGDMPGIALDRPRVDRRASRNILIVNARIDRVRGWGSIDNSGSGPVGPIRARVSAEFSSIGVAGDRLSVGAVVTPAQPGEFQYVEAG